MQKIGFIGLGLMGRHMAGKLLAAGHPLSVWNRTRDKAQALLDAGATWSASPAELAAEVEIVITMVTDSAASEQVICGEAGVLAGAAKGLTLIDMGSIAPATSRELAARCREAGVRMLDAPVTGAPRVAEAGKLGIMVGGPHEVFESVKPVLEKMGVVIVYAGDSGQGSTLKLINNLILGVAIEAVGEALALARKAGIDPQRVVEITSVGGARTGAMETRGPKMIEGNFKPGFTIDNMHKDLGNVMQLAAEFGAGVPTARAALEILERAREQGLGAMDSCSVIRILESMRD